jgi:hypothetical protein
MSAERSGARFDWTVWVFVAGVLIATCYAARVVPAQPAPAPPPTPSARLLGWAKVAGLEFSLGVVLMLSGAMLHRARRRRSLTGGERSTDARESDDDRLDPAGRLEAMARGLGESRALAEAGESARVRARLDTILEADVPAFLQQAPQLQVRLGALRYAELMGHFASFERNAARAWSASTDRADAEVAPCLERAAEAIERARAELERGTSTRTTPLAGSEPADGAS